MTHPFFDRRRFPRAREDARAFLDRLKNVVSEPRDIEVLYEESGGRVIDVDFRRSPSDVWDDAIQKLAVRGLIKTLCDRILANEAEYGTLRDVTLAIINAGATHRDTTQATALPGDPAQLSRFLRNCIGRAATVQGLTILLSPYAAYDAHEKDNPRALGEQVFDQAFHRRLREYMRDLGEAASDVQEPDFSSDILVNLLVATAASYAVSTDYDSVWSGFCVPPPEEEEEPLGLHDQVSGLAQISCDVIRSGLDSLEWAGLLVVSFDVSSRLEKALARDGIDFGVLRLLNDGTVAQNRHKGGMRFSESVILGESVDARTFQPVMILKMLGWRHLKQDRPILGLEVLNRFRQINTIPRLVQKHLAKKPFVMLGGGLLDPFVALSFETLIRPAFADSAEIPVRNSRWVVLHPEGRRDSVVRTVEHAIDQLNPDWASVFDLYRLIHKLPEIVAAIGTRLSDAAAENEIQ